MPLDFQPFSLDDQQAYISFLSRCGQKASDYSFVNLWGWMLEYGLERAFLDDCVLVRQTRPDTIFWAPLGDWTTINWGRIHRAVEGRCRFIRVPEALKDIMVVQCRDIEVLENRKHWDYLYSVEELVELKGNRFHKKKNLLSQFLRRNDHRYVRLDRHSVEHALGLQTEWMLWRGGESDSTLVAENKAIVRVMHDWDRLDRIFGAGLTVGGHMVAYTIAEPLDENTVVIHFEKGCPNVKGVYQAINSLFLANDCQKFALVNREQDLGDEGLRKAKLSYNPVGFLKKFEIRMA